MSTPSLRRDAPSALDVASLRAATAGIDDYNILIHQAAKWYASNGFCIIPFGAWGSYPKGLSQRHASKNLKKIDEWWHPIDGAYPGAAIAMAHGGESGLCAIDLDVKPERTKKVDGQDVLLPAVDGISVLADLQAAYGEYNDGDGEGLQTLMATTPSGGRHLVFKYHPEIISNSERFYDGIDSRGGFKNNPIINGGITFVEPSRKPGTDGYYRWDNDILNIIDVPQWLVDVLNGRKPKTNKGIQLQDSYVQSAAGDHGDGRDRNIYMDLMRFVGIGYTEDQLWALMPDILERMDPPDEAMVRRKIESAIQSEAFRKAKDETKARKIVDTLDLDKTPKGNILSSAKNLSTIIKSPIFAFEYGTFEYDDFYQRFARDGSPISMVADYSVGIQLWISEMFGVEFAPATIRGTIEYIAFNERKHANAARDYMLACPPYYGERDQNYWGSGRAGPGPAFHRLCTEILQLDSKLHSEYTPETRESYMGFLWFWLQGAAARACVPGCKMEIVLNIFGGQGVGKSTFFRELCPDPKWFTDSIQDSIVASGRDNKDELSKLHAKMIVEMPELSPIKRGGKSADDKIKQFISTQFDNYRRAYGHDTVDHPRTCALCGTANNNDVYRDATGARRFVSIDHGQTPIKVGDLDTGVMAEIRDALWGEIVSSFRPGELSKPANVLLVAIPKPLREKQSDINDAHRYEEIGLQEVIDWMDDKTRITWQEVVEYGRSIAGLRDAKESHIMLLVRQSLSQSDDWQFKKRVMRTNKANEKEKTNCWVNTKHPYEVELQPGQPAPPHWSGSIKPEY